MGQEYGRNVRVGDQIQRILGQLLLTRLNDPRLHWVTLSRVELSKDLRHAKVYFSLMDDDQVPQVQKALRKAAGMLRHELGREVALKKGVPELTFVYDKEYRQGMALSGLIDKAVTLDKKKRSEHE